MAAIKLYNFLTRKKAIFKPLKKGRAGFYTCGPTVYNYPHIGNYRSYIFEDVLRRVLESAGYEVKHVMNITDVGHLTDDADSGEDKLELEAKKENKSVWDIAKFYTEIFFQNIEKLNIEPPHIKAPATEHIEDQIALIKQLIKKGYAYETPTAVYFNVSKFKRYGKYSRQDFSKLKTGAREEVVLDPQKKNPADFALWFKLVGKFENHTMRWNSPWGPGFPGWHIECSAISTKYLGQPFDIHAGGVDHIFPHHTNEIAQSEAAYGKKLAHYWLEGEHLLVDGGKMAKSLGNVFTINDLQDKNFDPLAFRYLVLGAHYRTQLNFTWESLQAAQNSLRRLQELVLNLKKEIDDPKKQEKNMHTLAKFGSRASKAFFDDLDTPKALAELWGIVNEYNKNMGKYDSGGVLALLLQIDRVLGLGLSDVKDGEQPGEDILRLLKEREEARNVRDFALADALRQKISNLGWEIRDTPDGARLKKR